MEKGDWVTWTTVQTRGRLMTFRSVTGRIVKIEGETATVQRQGRKAEVMPLGRLRLESDRSELTELVMGKGDKKNE